MTVSCEELVGQLRALLPDPNKLRVLAEWFDLDGHPAPGTHEAQVQDDLRRWSVNADRARRLIDAALDEPDEISVRRRAIHDCWLAVHSRRFDGDSPDWTGPDNVYRGIQIAENELRRLWAETGETREIGSVSDAEV